MRVLISLGFASGFTTENATVRRNAAGGFDGLSETRPRRDGKDVLLCEQPDCILASEGRMGSQSEAVYHAITEHLQHSNPTKYCMKDCLNEPYAVVHELVRHFKQDHLTPPELCVSNIDIN